ncbi:MAG: monofunctional biosynthetic peptidoglycan transglycosylase [Rhizobiales bacterium]|nr:monofunctional biosynthetic peptidoglycan transglycosylase [Hyphomicrobiales bacterium]
MTSRPAVVAATGAGSKPGRRASWLRTPHIRLREMARIAIVLAGVLVAHHLALVAIYRFVDPPGSNAILAHYIKTGAVDHRWVDLDDISPNVLKAVVMAEDARFCRHWGVDLVELHHAVMTRGGRGASTITMQTAKNLFLWSGRSYLRKAIELPLATAIDLVWPKRRVLEVYLNIAEWAPGVYGIEAAAQHHFSKRASQLSGREAALLAASLPNPAVRDAGDAGPRTQRKAAIIAKRMAAAGNYAGCVL